MNAPAYFCEIVCLANSRKHSGRCIAGKIIDGPQAGEWVRPVSRRPGAEISELERRFKNGSSPALLDILRVPLKTKAPHPYQPENHMIDGKFYWSATGRMDWAGIAKLADEVQGELWANLSSSKFGLNDRVHDGHAPETTLDFGSLKLLHLDNLLISVAAEDQAGSGAKRRVRGAFTCSGLRYRLMVTDPVVESRYLAMEDGKHPVGEALICVSLGESFNGYAYKLIASVLPAVVS
jgi:hypothetical protein